MHRNNKLSIIVPAYNEEEVIQSSSKILISKLQELINSDTISSTSNIVFIDDGSSDTTWHKIYELTQKYDCIKGIKLSRNYGHQNAVLAGLFTTKSDVYITIDIDLQDDINVMNKMLENYLNGDDIVYGVRDKRDTDTFFKRHLAQLFYKGIKFIGIETIYNHADYRLMSKKIINALKNFKEVDCYIRGIIPLIGYQSSIVHYNRTARQYGTSKYNFFKSLSLAWSGITSLSIAPLRLISLVGFIVFLASLGLGLWSLFIKIFTDLPVSGWASTVVPIYFIGGIQLLSLGIIGEYVGKIYNETKARPRFIIEKTTK